MVPAVVLVLALAASGFSLPFTTQDIGQIENETVQQTLTEVPEAQFVEKTGVESSSQGHSHVGQVHPVSKVENVPVKIEQQQVSNSENPVFLPVQPLSVVPQVPQVLRPVIVPAEAITSGRVIIAGIETIQQRSFPQNEVVSVENAVPQVVHPVTYTQVQAQQVQPGQQAYYVQPQIPVVQQEVVSTGQEYVPVQVQTNQQPLVREHTVPVNVVQENVEQVQNYNPVPVEPYPQVYSVPQSVQHVVVQSPENVPYVPVQTVQQPVHQVVEKQVPYQQSYGSVQIQGVVAENQQYNSYSGTPVVVENVEKQVPQQQSTEYQQQQVYSAQQAEMHGEYQQVSSYTPVQKQPVYDVQQVVEKQGQYPVQSVVPQQQQTIQQEVESQVPVQRSGPVEPVHQQVYVEPVVPNQPVQTYPEESISHQQVYSLQPVVEQVVNEVPYHPSVQEQTAEYVPEIVSKSSEVEHELPYTQQQQVVNYSTRTTYNFGDKIPQHQSPVQVFSSVPQPQGVSVQPSVVSSQE